MRDHSISGTKVFFLGLILYISTAAFFFFGTKWVVGFEAKSEWEDRGKKMRGRFWKSFFLVFAAIALTVAFLHFLGGSFDSGFWIRVSAVMASLTATLGRGGHLIESWDGNSLLERTDHE